MRTMRLIPAGPPDGRAAGRRRGLWLGSSVLAHVLALLAVLFLTRRPEPQEQIAPSYDLVFEGTGSNVPSTSPERGDAQPPSKASPESMASPPVEAAPPAAALAPPEPAPDPAPPPAATVPPPEPLPPGPVTPTAPVPDAVPPPAAPPAPASEVPPAQADAAVRLEVPPPPMPTTLVPDLVLPQPPLPLPAPAPRPRPAARPRSAPPPGSFANPMDLSFNQTPRQGERLAAPRTGAPPGSVASRSMDLSLGAPKAGADRSSAYFDARARNLGADWMQGVQQFWLRHRYYPRQAAESGEDGSVDLELTVGKTGRVQSAVLKSHSGSSWIDMAAVGTFRGAQLPPLPEEVGDPYTVTISINYILIR